MIPKVEFVYSFPYDGRYREAVGLRFPSMKYPSPMKIRNFNSKMEKVWRKEESKILNGITKICGLKWSEEKIRCYVIGLGRGLSDPLTIKIDTTDRFIDVLIHELVHQVQMQNSNKTKKWWYYANKKYKKEHPVTIRHIFLDAVQYKLFLLLYTKKRLDEQIKFESIPNYKGKISSDEIKHYARAWEIVLDEGADNIIKNFHEVIK